ncbi:MAG: hypothetical protein AAF628_31800 [Planctomycetota bacterium]
MHIRILVAAGTLLAGTLAAQPVVSPADRVGLEGSSTTSYPLGRFNCRLQQLHADLPQAGMTVAGHAYRRDAISTRGAVESYRVELSVALSAAPLTPETASRTFAQNAGATPVVVLPRTWIDFPATQRPSIDPAPLFELRIPYATTYAWAGGAAATLCMDTTVCGNDGPNGPNANFTAYEDAHELHDDGTAEQPGYRYGNGCPAPGSSRAATATFELRHLPTGMELEIKARDGVASTPATPAVSALLIGFGAQSVSWPIRPTCTLLTEIVAAGVLNGANDDQGDWTGIVQAMRLPVGMDLYLQIASGHPLGGATLSDASHVQIPPLGQVPPAAVRIAHGSDRASASGTVSATVPVTEFF